MSETPLSDLWEQTEPPPRWRRARLTIPRERAERIAAWAAACYVALVLATLAAVLRP